MDKTEEILFGEKIRACFKDVLNISDDLIITFREELDREEIIFNTHMSNRDADGMIEDMGRMYGMDVNR